MSPSAVVPSLPFREWKYLDANLIWIYEGAPQDQSKASAVNSYFTVWYLQTGQVTLSGDGGDLKIPAGQWVLIPPGDSRRKFRQGAKILSISFDARWISGQSLFDCRAAVVLDRGYTGGWLGLTKPMLEMVQHRYPAALNQLPWETTEYEVYAELQWFFQRWLAQLWKAMRAVGVATFVPHGEDRRAMEMRMRLDAQPIQEVFRISQLSEEIGLSESQVNRIFFQAFGTTPKRYFDQRRLSYAKASLSTSELQVKEIGFGAGFRYQSEFSSWFKKHTGKTPVEFRNRG